MNPEVSLANSALERLRDRTLTTLELTDLLIQHRMLPQLYRELLIDQAIANITCDDTETEAALKQFCAANQITDAAHQQAWLEQTGLTSNQLTTIATRGLKIEKFKQATWGKHLEAYFLSCKAQFDQATYSLLRTKKFAIAQELYFRIKAGEESFADVARAYSQGPEAQTGGLLGPMPLTQPHPALATRLRSAQPGELIPPFQLGEWIVIVRLEQFRAARLDDQTRSTLLDKLFQQWLQETLSQLLQASPLPTIASLP